MHTAAYYRDQASYFRSLADGAEARTSADLIRVAEQEKDPELRREALRRLRLMGTPKAKQYLDKIAR